MIVRRDSTVFNGAHCEAGSRMSEEQASAHLLENSHTYIGYATLDARPGDVFFARLGASLFDNSPGCTTPRRSRPRSCTPRSAVTCAPTTPSPRGPAISIAQRMRTSSSRARSRRSTRTRSWGAARARAECPSSSFATRGADLAFCGPGHRCRTSRTAPSGCRRVPSPSTSPTEEILPERAPR